MGPRNQQDGVRMTIKSTNSMSPFPSTNSMAPFQAKSMKPFSGNHSCLASTSAFVLKCQGLKAN